MAETLGLLVASCLVVLATYGASASMAVARRPGLLPFESGMPPAQHAVSRYHAHWYATPASPSCGPCWPTTTEPLGIDHLVAVPAGTPTRIIHADGLRAKFYDYLK